MEGWSPTASVFSSVISQTNCVYSKFIAKCHDSDGRLWDLASTRFGHFQSDTHNNLWLVDHADAHRAWDELVEGCGARGWLLGAKIGGTNDWWSYELVKS